MSTVFGFGEVRAVVKATSVKKVDMLRAFWPDYWLKYLPEGKIFFHRGE